MSAVRNDVRARLLAGGEAWGVMAFEFFTPGLSRVLAHAGAEFVILDMEHSGAGIDTIKAQCAFARGIGLVPMVRVPTLAYHLVAPVLDAGALGIMAPMLETPAQAEELVRFCRYRPEGRRGLAFGLGHDDWSGGPAAAKIEAANRAVMTIALIESRRGIENCAAIMATPGIDCGWFGHFDLSDSMGIVERFDHPDFVAAEQRLLAAASAAGKPVGWVAGDAAGARAARAKGYRALCIGHEAGFLRASLAAAFAAAKA